MTLREPETIDLSTPTGPMRTLVIRPAGAGRHPGILFHSEIFQNTGPIRRTAAWLDGHGFIVALPAPTPPPPPSSPTNPPPPPPSSPTIRPAPTSATASNPPTPSPATTPTTP